MTPTVNVSLRFGPMLIGVFLNMILFGILIVQTTTYYQVYTKDALWMKLLVAYLFLLEIANSVCDMIMMYEPLIKSYGSVEAASRFPSLFFTEPILMALIACPIQIFFAWRIQRVTGYWWIPAVISVLAFASCAGGIWTGVMVGEVKLFARKPELHTPALVWFLTSCVADIMITLTLVYSLSQRKTGFAVTDSVIDKIIKTTVQTGMITAICAVGDVAFFMTLPKTALNFLWDLTLSKLYMNCLMSTLNARATYQGSLNTGGNSSTHPYGGGTADRRQTGRFFTNVGNPMSPNRAVFELEHPKSKTGTYISTNRDLECGVTVTKVIEQLSDQEPNTPRSSQPLTQ